MSSAFRDRATSALQGLNYSLVTAHIGDQLVGFAFLAVGGWVHPEKLGTPMLRRGRRSIGNEVSLGVYRRRFKRRTRTE